MEPVGERFRLGRVVGRSFAIWGRELPLLLALTFVVHVPRVVSIECLALARPEFPKDETRAGVPRSHADALLAWLDRSLRVEFALSLLQSLFTYLSLALVIFAVYARLRGRPAAFRESVRGGLRRFLPVLRVSLFLSLVATALYWGPWFFELNSALVRWTFRFPTISLLLLSPFWVAVPAAVVEEPRALLRRSWRLTRGHRLAICAILLLLFAIGWGSGQLVRLGLGSAHLPLLARRSTWWTQDLLVVSLTAVLAAVGYHALRLEKEGVDVSDLERVFA